MSTFPTNPGTEVSGGVCAPIGYVASAYGCGVKDPNNPRLDLGLIFSRFPTTSAGVFTTNQIKAAPVRVSQDHLADGNLRAFLVNSGNANACTGAQGMVDARRCTSEVAASLSLRPNEVGVCSTGVIGLPLPADRISASLPDLVHGLQSTSKSAQEFSDAILTSDTRRKEIAIELTIHGVPVRIGACAKGAGMIQPNMATMLCFVTTDAALSKEQLQSCLRDSSESTFNRISIDGDMSTNDTVLLMANGQSGVDLSNDEAGLQKFQKGLTFVLDFLARAVVLDGEKVSKFITLVVKNAQSTCDAQKIAEAVANSPLVKSSWNGDDPNWGRVIHAIGYSRAQIQEDQIDIAWGEHLACEGGALGPASISALRSIASKPAFTLTIDLHLGSADYYMYTSDLSPEYIDYNRSEYSYWNALEKHQK